MATTPTPTPAKPKAFRRLVRKDGRLVVAFYDGSGKEIPTANLGNYDTSQDTANTNGILPNSTGTGTTTPTPTTTPPPTGTGTSGGHSSASDGIGSGAQQPSGVMSGGLLGWLTGGLLGNKETVNKDSGTITGSSDSPRNIMPPASGTGQSTGSGAVDPLHPPSSVGGAGGSITGGVASIGSAAGGSGPTKGYYGHITTDGSADTSKINPQLYKILDDAAQRSPYKVVITSGDRPGDPRFHGQDLAVDIKLIDPVTGKELNNYQDPKTFRAYEQLAQTAKMVQQAEYPGLSPDFRWGGYFGNDPKTGKAVYGSQDTMHFDLGGRQYGMLGGSWQNGLTDTQRKLMPGVVSVGMGDLTKWTKLTPPGVSPIAEIQQAEAQSAQQPGPTNSNSWTQAVTNVLGQAKANAGDKTPVIPPPNGGNDLLSNVGQETNPMLGPNARSDAVGTGPGSMQDMNSFANSTGSAGLVNGAKSGLITKELGPDGYATTVDKAGTSQMPANYRPTSVGPPPTDDPYSAAAAQTHQAFLDAGGVPSKVQAANQQLGADPTAIVGPSPDVASAGGSMGNIGAGSAITNPDVARTAQPSNTVSSIQINPDGTPVNNDHNPIDPDIAYKSAYLDQINKAEGAPEANTLFGGKTVDAGYDHPNTKVFYDNGNAYSTAAGKYQIVAGTWASNASKVGGADFSNPADQMKVAWQIASDNYKATTHGRDLLTDLKNGNDDAIASAYVNNANQWSSLPGGTQVRSSINDLVQGYKTDLANYRPADVVIPATNVQGPGGGLTLPGSGFMNSTASTASGTISGLNQKDNHMAGGIAGSIAGGISATAQSDSFMNMEPRVPENNQSTGGVASGGFAGSGGAVAGSGVHENGPGTTEASTGSGNSGVGSFGGVGGSIGSSAGGAASGGFAGAGGAAGGSPKMNSSGSPDDRNTSKPMNSSGSPDDRSNPVPMNSSGSPDDRNK